MKLIGEPNNSICFDVEPTSSGFESVVRIIFLQLEHRAASFAASAIETLDRIFLQPRRLFQVRQMHCFVLQRLPVVSQPCPGHSVLSNTIRAVKRLCIHQ